LVTQHIDSYNYFVTAGIKEHMNASTNKVLRSDSDTSWFWEYKDIYIGKPFITEDAGIVSTNPMMCRLRDLTYSAPIYVDIEYYKAGMRHKSSRIEIGRLPVMLRSKLCVLHGATESDMEGLGECPYDPGGYFIVKGVERVLMMQEQQLYNRIIVELDSKKQIIAFVMSSTADSKSRTVICGHTSIKKKGLYMKHSAFTDLVSVGIVMKAMGVQLTWKFFKWLDLSRCS